MAEARGRPGVTGARRRRGRDRAVVTRIVALAALAAAGWLAVRGLRLAGFELRWEREARATASVASGGAPVPSGGSAAVARRPAARLPSRRSSETADPASGRPSGAAHRASGRPALEPPPVRDAPAGPGAPATIRFDRLPDGSQTCTPCAVGTEWSGEGLVVSFRSWTAGSTLPMVIDGRELLPVGRSARVLGPAFLPERGLEVGVIRLDFPGRPRRVSFSVFGPDLVRRFEVLVWSGGGVPADGRVRRTVRDRYDAGGTGTFREERITVTAEEGIDRISLDGWGPPGHLLFVDDLRITP